MSSYARKIISFFLFIYILFTPSTVINALAKDNIKPEKLHTHLKKTNDTSELDIPHVIGSNVQRVSHILSSSPSELVEQATSYALGKFNSALSSETQKWLSQFGTARINFGLDRKWTLKNNSLDILLPLYDNKANWLFFSQLGYRNKESRNTINLGLGGRYFYQNWMYGLNTFYDHDFTGKNQRLGLGGEIWGDYIKLSANAYYRLSDWQKSRNFQDYHERPATGYDINGEFFLPVYPNLGAKLTYEQYFGDNVTLFNRDTKQKNPRQAKLDLTYTPIPLVTIGVGYRQGEKGHTETQFLANLNYKFGTPLSTQLSPANVALMRTLAGSRYDLVERNNNIVMDHQKREKTEPAELFALEPIIGYGQQEISVNAPIRSYTNIKHISWVVPDKAFKDNHGKLSSDSGRSIVITLPSYQETHKTGYKLDISITDNQGKTHVIQNTIKVLPFLIDGKVNITGNEKNEYTFSDPIITYQGSPAGEFVKNARINKVIWTTEPPLGDESGLSFKWNNKPAKTNEKGELTNEKGQLMSNILTNEKSLNEIKVYIQLDGAPRQEIGTVQSSPVKYRVKNIDIDKKSPLIANGEDTYTYTAYIVGQDGNPVSEGQVVSNVRWNKDNNNPGLKFTFENGKDKTGPGGTLMAKLSSTAEVDKVVVSLAVEEQASPTLTKPVKFILDEKELEININISPTGSLMANNSDTYIYTATITDKKTSSNLSNYKFDSVEWTVSENIAGITVTKDSDATDSQGNLVARVISNVGIDDFSVKLTLNKNISKTSDKRTFNSIPKKARILLYNNNNPAVNSDNGHIIFSNSPAPVNAFSSLSGVLRNSDGKKITKSDNHSVVFASTNPDITSIDSDTGEISFYKPGNATLSATITNKSNGIKELYVYTTKVKRYFAQDPNNYDDMQWNDRKNCENSGLVTPNLKSDIFNNNSNNNENVTPVLSVEFPDISLWDLLPIGNNTNSSTSSGTIFFFVLNNGGEYLIYNSWDHSTYPASVGGGYLLCVVK
ncbi:inverse autotransporter beta domain-containing protein [Xenorhabdus budapestensis]|uniref:inverse autotransporter beta domain-containing protein n=1 Tax=Xenorhabdus budapestensis TaxID=290110 RepID=UPI003A8586B2